MVKTPQRGGKVADKIQVGRPRLPVDFAIVLRMRDEQILGWSRMAEAYRELTGQYISRETIKRRYLEAKAKTLKGGSSCDANTYQ